MFNPSLLFSKILLLVISFSDVTFKLFWGSESNPFPLILLTFFFLSVGKIDFKMLVALVSVFVFSVISFFGAVRLQTVLISLSAYMQLILVYFYYKKFGINFNIALCRWIVLFHLVIGVMQYLGFFGFILELPLSVMLERSNTTALIEIGRGVTFLTTEPSHALQSIIFPIFILSMSLKYIDKFIAFTTIILTIFLSSAGVSIIYGMVIVVLIVILRPIYILFFIVLYIVFFEVMSERAFVILSYFYNILFSDGLISFVSALEFSGFRFPSIFAPIYSLGSIPEMFGIGAWELNIIPSLYEAGFNVENLGHWKFTGELHPIKPYSVLGNLVSDLWWFGVLFFLLFFIYSIKDFISSGIFLKKSVISVSIYFLALFSIAFLVTIGKPAFIAILGVVAHYAKTNNRIY
jgi:hypothetical protein